MATRQQTGGRSKATLFLVLAFVVASLTAYAVWRAIAEMQEKVAKAQEGPDRVRVLVAARDIYMGEALTEVDLQPVALLPDMIYPEMVYTEEQVQEVLNRTARERILQGEIIREERLADADAGVGLNALIPRGMRAMAIEVDPQSSLAGLLQPGNRVDVIVTIRPDDRNIEAKWVTKTILQDKRVLAIGDRLKPRSAAEKAEENKSRRNRRTRPFVTLELTLEESESLALARSRGDLHLVLRSDVDNAQLERGEAVTTNSMMDLKPAGIRTAASPRSGRRSSKPAETPSVNTAEVIEGSTTTTMQFDKDGNRVETPSSGRRR
jgi:pilus assembly protein CpaB